MMYKTCNCIMLLNSVKLLSTKLLKKNRMIQVARVFSPPVYQSRLYCNNLNNLVQPVNSRKIVSLKYILSTDFPQYLEKEPDKIDWDSVRQYLLSICNAKINSVNINSVIIDLCFELCKLDAALSYLNFLKANNYEINSAMVVKQLKLYYFKKDSLTMNDKKNMLKIYDNIRQEYKQLPVSIAEICVSCVSLTYRWQESFEIVDHIKICNKPGDAVYNCIIIAAFNNNRLKIGWKYLMEMLSQNLHPGDEVYISYLDYCHRNQVSRFKVHMEKLFNVWHGHCIRITDNVAEQYTHIHNELGFPAKLVNVSDSGVCESCKQKLGHLKIEESDLEKIRQMIVQLLFDKNGPYCKTMPEVHNTFLRFIDRTKPYDVVIDALNIFYKNRNPCLIDTIINRFVSNGKKVLVIGRHHLKKHIFRDKQKDVRYLFVDNDTADDIYLLYAVISSGVNAEFVSGDLMRQHKHLLLDSELKNKFKVWQMSRQYTVVYTDTKNWNLTEPPIYAMVAQKNNNSWHIPYVNSPSIDSYEIIKSWACITYPRDNY